MTKYNPKYYAEHPEIYAKASKEWYQRNKERQKEYQRQQWLKNPEKIREYNRKSYQKHRIARMQQMKDKYFKMSEALKEKEGGLNDRNTKNQRIP